MQQVNKKSSFPAVSALSSYLANAIAKKGDTSIMGKI